jgi:hypothetical protein
MYCSFASMGHADIIIIIIRYQLDAGYLPSYA